VVSQRPLCDDQSHHFKGSHLSCACKPMAQCQPTVKLHRVFSSYRDSPGIFTWSAISPGLASRQYPHRDTIRAGRNFMCFAHRHKIKDIRRKSYSSVSMFLWMANPEPEPKLRRTKAFSINVCLMSCILHLVDRNDCFLANAQLCVPLHRCRDRTISCSEGRK
jgi:hypothetical protein